MKNQKIIVIGATGRVGREMLSILCENDFPVYNLHAAASARSCSFRIKYAEREVTVQDVANVDFSKYNIALFSAGSEVSKIYAPKAASNNCIVIDNTSHFRMFEDVSLIVPEINFSDIGKYENKKIIANPNCSTIQMVMALKPLHDAFRLKEVVASTYQATSGAGQKGAEELLDQTKQILNQKDVHPNHFKKQIAFNVIPQIDVFTDSLYTKEEIKMMEETKKILGLENLEITATCVRVPVLVGHCVSVFAKFERDVSIEEALDVLSGFEGIKVMDDYKNYGYATPIEAASQDYVFVSRIRKHPNLKNALSFWCVADNLRKGAALNAVQIAKKLFKV